ncbi:MAG: hypothetical protein LUG52_09280 [Clostridia bacterium]|nr:hypothetical protein [Clostridia bacterium]
MDFSGNPHSIITDPDNKNNDYKNFILRSVYNVKITNFLHDVFAINWEDFITKTQEHIIGNLKSADLSNSELAEYLRKVGNDTIVPKSISPTANSAFTSLLDSGDSKSVQKIIANFFISASLGLRAVYYKHGQQKTYLLNSMGMELIWRPDLITTSYKKLQSIKQWYSLGNYKKALDDAKAWLEEEETPGNKNKSAALPTGAPATQADFAAVYEILGDCLYLYTVKCEPNAEKNKSLRDSLQSEGVQYWEKCIDIPFVSSDVYFHLYEAYNETDSEKAKKYLLNAFDKYNAQAVIKCAESENKVSQEQLSEKLNYIITKRSDYTKLEVGKCLYRRALLYKKEGKNEDANKDIKEAASLGNEKALQQISREKRTERQTLPRFTNNTDAPCCFVNSLSGNNLVFISSLPNETWSLYTVDGAPAPGINAEFARNIDDFITSQNIGGSSFKRPRIVFLFMSENEQKNLNECLRLLDKLFNIALDASDKNRNTEMERMIDSIDIYIGAEYETASMLIDASVNDMGSNIYFKVHIADETRDCVHQLLCDAPLFIPYLNKGENSSNVVLFGCSETNYRFIKESIASSYLGSQRFVTMTMLGSDAHRLECKLRQECPGLYPEPQTACIKPEFIPCDISETDFPSLIYGKEHDENPDDPRVQALSRGNYFVVDFADDYSNIKFATSLRTWLLRSRGTFDRAPFIAVKCKDRQNSYLAEHLTLSGQPAGESYFSKYDLIPFGMADEIYSYHRLIEKPRLEETALNVHKSYYGDNERQAENDYYSFSYNADSSLLAAIGLSCRMFAAGAYFERREEYLNFKAFDNKELLEKYLKYCETPKNAEASAELEQSRWNGFMLSRGWECASNAQVQAYGKQSTGSSHKHTLAKLHPFIREWADFEDYDLGKTPGILKKEFQYEKDPRDTTRQSIKDTANFLKEPKKDETEEKNVEITT